MIYFTKLLLCNLLWWCKPHKEMAGHMRPVTASLRYKAGMNKIRPMGEMWPPKAYYLARKAKSCLYLSFGLLETPSKNISVRTIRYSLKQWF